MCDYLGNRFDKFDEWSIMPILPSGRALDYKHTKQYDSENYDFFNSYIDLINYAKQKFSNLYISAPVFNNTISTFCCGATFVQCYWIMPDKSIINCIEAERFKVTIGNINNGKVEYLDAYHDSHLDVVRKSFTECRNCLAYRFCKGGCPLKYIRDKQFGTEYKKYECSMITQYWEYTFNKILSGEQCFGWCVKPINNEDIAQYNVLQLSRIEEEK